MTLTLRLENLELLQDGSPAWLTLDGQNASVGRNRAMDWVLPDPSRHVSGHHFDINYHNGAYWLTDASTNGTFLQGQKHRIQGPLQLKGGERLIVGHYIISVETAAAGAPQAAMAPGPQTPQPSYDEADPWDLGLHPQDPVNPLPQPPADARAFDDVAQEFLQLTPQIPPQQGAAPPPPPQQPGPPQAAPSPQSPPPQVPPAASPAVAQPPSPAAYQAQPPATDLPPAGQPPIAPVPMPSPASPPPPQAAPLDPPAAPPAPPRPATPAAAPAAAQTDVLRAFCQGAGLDPSLADSTDPEHLAHALGQAVAAASQEIMRMLQDRASVKQFTKGGARTMRNAHGNNPMKFLPDTPQALEAMFLTPREGFMEGPESFATALADLRGHQQAVFAALQPALAAVLDGLSPEEIESSEDGRALLSGARRGKLWDQYVARWDKKAAEADHGMLDVFLKAFAQAYSEAAGQYGNFD
ncbi:type VI secretion system-associated FHA domain protein TagH [Epibacterium sp. Ofav1-8]|uniref:type VI secretion system-associated FHA domain protein TagH n=1 Tax=Epibacterium sp. Ofav1-8 TaxID=2917735 RepID=UPI001EF491BC|nr:type VI secretion system-associated FHA domain protein TagH [Epibacterium sp. Ofav1-8]MCG7625027.1 type VI secretion system-associated FHA domain protein TagH [Epibacterium sp. Ofav1-8]